jgi:predicted SprT family Zn-dependent metalloprotease
MITPGTFSVADLWDPSRPLPSGPVLRAIAQRCGQAWEAPDLARRVRIIYNPRMRTTIGQARLNEGVVELNTRLLIEHPEELIETLIHELAHVVVYWRYGQVRPHGREFLTLMRAVDLSGKATHELDVAHLRRRRAPRRRPGRIRRR